MKLSELVASLSIGTDIGMGQPEGQALRTCLLALGVAREMGLDHQQCADVYYVALLRFVGCNSHADQDASSAGGDEMAFRRAMATVISGTPQELVPHVVRHVGAGLPITKRARVVAGMLAAGPKQAQAVTSATCEVARMFAIQLRLGPTLVRALGYQFEYWNGKGLPNGVSGPVKGLIYGDGRGDGVRLSGYVAASFDLRFPQTRFRLARSALRWRGRYLFPAVPVVSAAL